MPQENRGGKPEPSDEGHDIAGVIVLCMLASPASQTPVVRFVMDMAGHGSFFACVWSTVLQAPLRWTHTEAS